MRLGEDGCQMKEVTFIYRIKDFGLGIRMALPVYVCSEGVFRDIIWASSEGNSLGFGVWMMALLVNDVLLRYPLHARRSKMSFFFVGFDL